MLRISTLLFALSLLAGCGKPPPASPAADGKPSVAATTTMVADMLRSIGGGRISIHALMGPGVDPHLYKPSADDARQLREAKAIFYNGLMLEGRMSELFDRLRSEGKPVFAVTEALAESELLKSDDDGSHPDPHVWGDASLWAKCVDVAVRGLSAADPGGKAEFEKNGAATKASYLKLHEWARQKSGSLPAESRILITSHDAFNYFGRAYGFKVVGVQGISTVSEAGLADITKTVDFIKQNKVRAIFVESSVSQAAIVRIARDSGAAIGGELFSDALGAPGDVLEIAGEQCDRGAYDGMLRSNMLKIVEALK